MMPRIRQKREKGLCEEPKGLDPPQGKNLRGTRRAEVLPDSSCALCEGTDHRRMAAFKSKDGCADTIGAKVPDLGGDEYGSFNWETKPPTQIG